MKLFPFWLLLFAIFSGCRPDDETHLPNGKQDERLAEVPKSSIYEVTLVKGNLREKLVVFQNDCPTFELGKMNMIENDRFPLEIFAGRSIGWTGFDLHENTEVEVKVVDKTKIPVVGQVRILPSRHGITPMIDGDIIRFTLSRPGQFSVEIGENGYKNGLLIFADPPENAAPNPTSTEYHFFQSGNAINIKTIPSSKSGIFFKRGIHNIGVYKVPVHIKNIYIERGAWVYGSLIMDGNSDVRIFGRGVLSSAKLNYRESHCIEAVNQSNNIQIEGIVVADPKHFAIRLIGQNNKVSWTKIVGGWVYNCDGISAFAGSTVSNCFIWANDDAIKVYRDNITWSDIVVWQLNNGGVIQMAWGGSNAANVILKRIDVIRAEWNKPGFNRALLNCVGNRYKEAGKTGIQQNWLIEDVVTENPVPIVFNITPDAFSPNHIHGLTLKNWNVRMPMKTNYQNMIIGNDPSDFFQGFVFENFIFNDTKLDLSNWLENTEMMVENLETPEFR